MRRWAVIAMKIRKPCNCSALISAIDAYVEKADKSLERELKKAGFVSPKKTVEDIAELEDELAKLLEADNRYVLTTINDFPRLRDFINEAWPEMQEETDLVEKLTRTFEGKFSETVPDYTAQYLHRVEADVKLEGIALTARTSNWIRSWSGELANLMKLSDDRHIQNILDKGIREGWSVQVTSEHLAEARIRDPGYRARRVATTEMLRAHSVAKQESFDQSPAVESKMWLHSGWRQYARLNHMELGFDKDRNTVKKDGTFTLYGADGGVYYPMYPRDSSLPPGESINCGCVCVPIVDENILGMSLEERDRLRKEAIRELDEEFNRKLDRQNAGLSLGVRDAKRWRNERGFSFSDDGNMLNTKDDPIREILGSAFDSHPNETNEIIKEMNAKGVEISYRDNTMGYQPNPTPGAPGKIIMDPESSYSAWLHERKHAVDDEKSGWRGFRNFIDPAIASRFEASAYDIEIEFAEKMGYNDMAERLRELKADRIKGILGDEND